MHTCTLMTDAQFQAMEDVDRFGDPYARVRGRAMPGAWEGTVRVIRTKREWIAFDISGSPPWVLTRKGAAALATERRLRHVRAA